MQEARCGAGRGVWGFPTSSLFLDACAELRLWVFGREDAGLCSSVCTTAAARNTYDVCTGNRERGRAVYTLVSRASPVVGCAVQCRPCPYRPCALQLHSDTANGRRIVTGVVHVHTSAQVIQRTLIKSSSVTSTFSVISS